MRTIGRTIWRDSVDQPHGNAVLDAKKLAGIEHPLGIGQPHLAIEQNAIEFAVYDSEPSGRNAHPRGRVTHAQVAGQCERATAADAETRNGCDRRLAAVAYCESCPLADSLVSAPGFDIG